MFPAAVDALERLFVQQANEVVFFCDFLHRLHHQLVVIRRDVRRGEDGRQFVLRRRGFVVFGLRQNPQFPKLLVQILHKRLHAGLDNAEIMVF